MRAEADGTVTIGITDHAQAALGDLVFIELPAVGRKLAAGRGLRRRRVGEGGERRLRADRRRSRRGATTRCRTRPETVNADAYAAWLFRLKPADAGALAAMLDAAAYEKLIGEA